MAKAAKASKADKAGFFSMAVNRYPALTLICPICNHDNQIVIIEGHPHYREHVTDMLVLVSSNPARCRDCDAELPPIDASKAD